MRAAVIPATLGAVMLTLLWTAAFITQLARITLRGEPIPADFPTQAGGRETAIFSLCYLPLLLWGPLLAALTYAYHRRRRNTDCLGVKRTTEEGPLQPARPGGATPRVNMNRPHPSEPEDH